jgi:hypothetical protein
MTATTWLTDANERWCRGDALAAGRMIYERLDASGRPGWADGVLGVCCAELTTVPLAVRAARHIARSTERWHEAHAAFQRIRQLTLAAETRCSVATSLEHGLLYLAENVAKVTYNASGSRAPFDHDAGWWVAQNARWFVEHAEDAELETRVWAALARPWERNG